MHAQPVIDRSMDRFISMNASVRAFIMYRSHMHVNVGNEDQSGKNTKRSAWCWVTGRGRGRARGGASGY